MKTIAICKEHHDSLYFDVSTPELLEAFALSLLRGRTSGKNDYYPIDEEDYEEPKRPISMTDEQVASLPEKDPVRRMSEELLDRYARQSEQVKEYKKQREMIKRAIDNNDGKFAVKVVKAFYGGYGEGEVHFVKLQERYPGDE